ncbi:hypothetical protein F442_15304 [Phytophthora nicotianae P10297]|uniref:Uncharacterized protein n=3 Tax=Phytophthora nicotianae TaxID=4792 RepID=W2YRL8_PHYNI|nr:hypothetical protein L915_15015 [Phytophthora nicotianae]ETM38933.1 hypothetical protein L914_14864 [Phytophthora nicotianae]ETO67636.1 hypothetical protein F444_15454 [Phytophthora nicotianae P1976]ETP36819.1 hypothetical protein F442_15304 [Phytophthora nicotianae P10297]
MIQSLRPGGSFSFAPARTQAHPPFEKQLQT